ncbi:hypothetical protein C8F04DRAFT_1186233 [Mycena alexandri]|uniref:Uncharacterized protein n=1 Tax=Mycena alexandri TaxID=1745969 RepID=A0AAD6SNX6_9AGAR|nr:hypothetical protein C8F04DRAFT_1186233 [Mycena alexandri]
MMRLTVELELDGDTFARRDIFAQTGRLLLRDTNPASPSEWREISQYHEGGTGEPQSRTQGGSHEARGVHGLSTLLVRSTKAGANGGWCEECDRRCARPQKLSPGGPDGMLHLHTYRGTKISARRAGALDSEERSLDLPGVLRARGRRDDLVSQKARFVMDAGIREFLAEMSAIPLSQQFYAFLANAPSLPWLRIFTTVVTLILAVILCRWGLLGFCGRRAANFSPKGSSEAPPLPSRPTGLPDPILAALRAPLALLALIDAGAETEGGAGRQPPAHQDEEGPAVERNVEADIVQLLLTASASAEAFALSADAFPAQQKQVDEELLPLWRETTRQQRELTSGHGRNFDGGFAHSRRPVLGQRGRSVARSPWLQPDGGAEGEEEHCWIGAVGKENVEVHSGKGKGKGKVPS